MLPNSILNPVKRGRNDPCPSGAGRKVKKCLLAHPDLSLDSLAGAFWWKCDRWQAPVPSDLDLFHALATVRGVPMERLTALQQRLLAAPVETIPWALLLSRFAYAGHPDLPGLFRQFADRLEPSHTAHLIALAEGALAVAGDHSPALLLAVAERYRRLDPHHLEPGNLRELHQRLRKSGKSEAADDLRQHFPALASLSNEELDGDLADPNDPDDTESGLSPERRPPSPEEIRANEIWDTFSALQSPTVEQMDAFLDDCLALPSEVIEWPEVLHRLEKRGHPDLWSAYRRLATDVRSPGKGFAFVHMAATEIAEKRKQPEWFPEIARYFARLDGVSYDADALFYLLDRLMYHGHGRAALDLAGLFLPIVAADDQLIGSSIYDLAWRVFDLRIGLRLLSADPPAGDDPGGREEVAAALRHGLEKYFSIEAAHQAATHLDSRTPEPSWTRQSFQTDTGEDADDQEILTNAMRLMATQVWFWREAWQLDRLSPFLIALGWKGALYMSSEAAEKSGLNSPNLLDHLVTKGLERRIARVTADIIGTNVIQALALIRTLSALARFAQRRSLLDPPRYDAVAKVLTQLEARLTA